MNDSRADWLDVYGLDPDALERLRATSEIRQRLFGRGSPLRIGTWPALRVLGHGANAVVYATRTPQGDPRAIKVLREDADRTALERLRRESATLAGLDHPHVLRVFEVGEHEGRAFIVSEQAERSLSEWLRSEVSSAAIHMALRQVLEGLAAAHALDLIHRDVKPANVLLREDGSALLSDFGLVKSTEASARDKLTATGQLLGTLAYAPPEQLRGETLDARADVYSFAVTAFEALFGTRPAAPKPRRPAELPPADRNGEPVPAFLRTLISDGLSWARSSRSSNAAEMLARWTR